MQQKIAIIIALKQLRGGYAQSGGNGGVAGFDNVCKRGVLELKACAADGRGQWGGSSGKECR
jgi:hypothetical protein